MPHMLTDKDRLSSLLLQQKHLAEECNKSAMHTDDPQLLQTLTQILGEAQRTRLEIYQAMHARGWYNPQLIDQTQLDQSKRQFQQTQQKLRTMLQTATSQPGQSVPGASPQQYNTYATGQPSPAAQHQGYVQSPTHSTSWSQRSQ